MFGPRHHKVIRRANRRTLGFVRSTGRSWVVVSDAEADTAALAFLRRHGFTDPPHPPAQPLLECFANPATRREADAYAFAFGDWVKSNEAAIQALRDEHQGVWRNIMDYSRALYVESLNRPRR